MASVCIEYNIKSIRTGVTYATAIKFLEPEATRLFWRSPSFDIMKKSEKLGENATLEAVAQIVTEWLEANNQ